MDRIRAGPRDVAREMGGKNEAKPHATREGQLGDGALACERAKGGDREQHSREHRRRREIVGAGGNQDLGLGETDLPIGPCEKTRETKAVEGRSCREREQRRADCRAQERVSTTAMNPEQDRAKGRRRAELEGVERSVVVAGDVTGRSEADGSESRSNEERHPPSTPVCAIICPANHALASANSRPIAYDMAPGYTIRAASLRRPRLERESTGAGGSAGGSVVYWPG